MAVSKQTALTAAKRKTSSKPASAAKKGNSGKTSSAVRKPAKKGTSVKKTSRKAGTGKGNASAKPFPRNTDGNFFPILREVLAILGLGFCALLFFAAFEQKGPTLSKLHDTLHGAFGNASYVIPFLVLAAVLLILFRSGVHGLLSKLFALFLWGTAACGLSSLFFTSGGSAGSAIRKILDPIVGQVGVYIIMVILFMIGLVILTGKSLLKILKNNSERAMDAVREGQELLESGRRIRMSERELERERRRSERIIREQRRLEEIEEQKRREIEHRRRLADELVRVRGIGDNTLEPDDEDMEYLEAREAYKREQEKARQKAAGKRKKDRTAEQDASAASDLPDLMHEIRFGKGAQNPDHISSGKDSRSEKDLEILDLSAREEKAVDLSEEASAAVDFSMDDVISQALSAVPENRPESPDSPEKLLWDEAPEKEHAGLEPPAGADIPDDSIFEHNGGLSEIYEQELPPDSVPNPSSGKGLTWLESQGITETETVKTVRTASGKIISHELDSLPGQRKLPKETPSEKAPAEDAITIQEYVEPKEYVFPPVSLLKKGSGSSTSREETARELKETAMKLQQTLHTFGVGVTVTNISCGPTVTRYELQPEQGVKVSKIVSLTDDIKLNLAAEDIRMEAPIPGKAAIGIEIPNREKQSVMLRDLLESDEFKNHKSKIVFAAGRDISGGIVLADIAKMPHLLIAGATGSGKSVCINTIIMSILYKSKPSEVKLIMIDPKVVELSVYNGIPHLLLPVVTDPKKAAAALNWAVTEMMDRYQKFADYKVRDMKGYNAKVEQAIRDAGEDAKNLPKKMPQIVIIVDELADLMMVAPGDVEEAICRLAQLARAAGIHLIIATQRPSVNVITGLIKANVPSRIAFSVSSGTDSRIIIDMNGAEKLLGKGDMLFYPSGYPKPLRVQGSFVSDDEVQEVSRFLAEQGTVIGGEQNAEINLENTSGDSAPGQSAADNDRDEYYEKAARFMIEKDKASIGMLQRLFKIGFNRAARIMDQLAQEGVVSEEEGTKPRKVLMTMAEFDAMLQSR